MQSPASSDDRIALLIKFRELILRWFDGQYEPEGEEALRSQINRNKKAAEAAVRDAGCLGSLTIAPPVAIGGMVVQNANPFETIFQSFWGISLIKDAADMCDEAIGVYEHLKTGTGLVVLPKKETIDIASAIERALRPAFRVQPPASEREVQDAIETIFNALGVRFTREQDTAPVAARAFKPDFVLADLDLAVEVKLARPSHGESKVQEELAADITAYRTIWRHILFVVYDLGSISDPARLRQENMRLFGVHVLVVKH